MHSGNLSFVSNNFVEKSNRGIGLAKQELRTPSYKKEGMVGAKAKHGESEKQRNPSIDSSAEIS